MAEMWNATEHLEELVDDLGLAEVLGLLSDVCDGKVHQARAPEAASVEERLQSRVVSHPWEIMAAALNAESERARGLGLKNE